MITLEVFNIYIENINTIKNIYPELIPEIISIKKKFKLEYDITEQHEEFTSQKNIKLYKNIKKNIKMSITSSIMSILSLRDRFNKILYLRNIFDYYELDERVDYCKLIILYNGEKNNYEKGI